MWRHAHLGHTDLHAYPMHYRPAHCMAGLAQITPLAILTDSTPFFIRAPPLCSEGHNRATSRDQYVVPKVNSWR